MHITKAIILFLLAGLIASSVGCAEDRAIVKKRAKAMEDIGIAAARKGALQPRARGICGSP
ncbi:MAG: hypothetical protein JRJ51_01190 [Deltaproteobacteria bacterium]|nr:hypothetical protein [Deltaproteobacteria bacterium]